jgi:Relaxase/Mobilisation nuclease domain
MIVKGSSRGGASQLGPYLLSTKENTRTELLELRSPIDNLTESIEDWQTLADGTKQGKKGLYHAQIAPAHGYQMPREQWFRSVDLLEQELGLTGQPRAVVLHNKDGKDHLHVVWQRTDLETMKFISDSQNYAAHERVSQILEQEFGHQPVPGKHAKHEKKPVDEQTRARDLHMKETVTKLYRQSDNAQSFKTALEEEGYVLAKGDRRPHIVVDADGKEHSLSRCLPDLTPKQIREFMAAIDRNTLPTAEEAKVLQREAAKTAAQDQKPAAEPPKPETPQPPPLEPPPVQQQPEPSKPQPDPNAEQLAKLEAALKARHEEETRQLRQQQEAERNTKAKTHDRTAAEQLYESDALRAAIIDQYDHEQTPDRGRFAAFIAIIRGWFNPAKEEEQIRQREYERAEFVRAQQKDRDDQIINFNKASQQDAVDLARLHAEQQRQHDARYAEDVARHTREHQEACRLRAEIDAPRRQEELNKQQQQPPPDRPL